MNWHNSCAGRSDAAYEHRSTEMSLKQLVCSPEKPEDCLVPRLCFMEKVARDELFCQFVFSGRRRSLQWHTAHLVAFWMDKFFGLQVHHQSPSSSNAVYGLWPIIWRFWRSSNKVLSCNRRHNLLSKGVKALREHLVPPSVIQVDTDSELNQTEKLKVEKFSDLFRHRSRERSWPMDL